jgi:hypothetical protein
MADNNGNGNGDNLRSGLSALTGSGTSRGSRGSTAPPVVPVTPPTTEPNVQGTTDKKGLDVIKGGKRGQDNQQIHQGFMSTINRDEYKDYIKELRIDQSLDDINTQRARGQSFGAQALGWVNQSLVGEILGGTIGAIGTLGEAPEMIYNAIYGGTTDFDNYMISLGDDIQNSTRATTPIYQLKEDGNFSFGDSGWWFKNGVSMASTLSMMVPALGATKALTAFKMMTSALAKATNVAGKANKLKQLTQAAKVARGAAPVEKVTGKLRMQAAADNILNAGTNMGRTSKDLIKQLTGAAVMRHAENTKEAFGVVNDVKRESLAAFTDDEKYNEVLASEVGKDFVKMAAERGLDITKENLANYVASNAGYYTYQVNSANIVFDFIQMGTILSPLGRTRGVARNNKINTALGQAPKTKFGRAFANASPYAMAVGRQSTEGIEEVINYIGGEEGKYYGKKMIGTDKSGEEPESEFFTERTMKNLQNADAWEAGLWGMIGGVAFEQIGGRVTGANKAAKEQQNALLKNIANREMAIAGFSAKIKEVQAAVDSGKMPRDKADRIISQQKSALALNMAINAAESRSIDVLLDQVRSKEFKDKMVANLTEEERLNFGLENIDNAISIMERDIIATETAYRKAYNNIAGKGLKPEAERAIIREQTGLLYENEKVLDAVGSVKSRVQALEETDDQIKNHANPHARDLVEIQALDEYIKDWELVAQHADTFQMDKKEIQSKIDKAKAKKEKLTKSINDAGGKIEIIDLKNKDLLDLHKEWVGYEATISHNNERINELNNSTGREAAQKAFDNNRAAEERRVKEKQFGDYKVSVDKLLANPDINQVVSNLEIEVKNQKNEEYRKYAEQKLADMKARQSVQQRIQAEPSLLQPTPTTEVTPTAPTTETGTETNWITEDDINNDYVNTVEDDDVIDGFAVFRGKKNSEGQRRALFDKFSDKIANIVNDKKLSVKQKLDNLKKLFDSPTFAENKAAKERIKGEYIKLAKAGKANTTADGTFTTSTNVVVGTTYSKDGNVYTVNSLYTDQLGKAWAEVSYTDSNGKVVKGKIALSVLEQSISTGNATIVTSTESTVIVNPVVNNADVVTSLKEVFVVLGNYEGVASNVRTVMQEFLRKYGYVVPTHIDNLFYSLNPIRPTIEITDKRLYNGAIAQFNPATNSITISLTAFEESGQDLAFLVEIAFAHEFVHFVLNNAFPVWNDKTGSVPEERKDFNEALKPVIDALRDLYAAKGGDFGRKTMNEIADAILTSSNPEEILTYFLTSPMTADYLVNTPVETKLRELFHAEPALAKLNELFAKAIVNAEPVNAPMPSPIRITEAARVLARDYDIDFSKIKGTGPNGMITKGDVVKYITDNQINLPAELQTLLATEEVTSTNNLGNNMQENNIYLSFVNLGIVNGVVDAGAYNKAVKEMYGYDPQVEQKDLEKIISTVLNPQLGKGSTIEIVPTPAGGYALKTLGGTLIGFINSPAGLIKTLGFAELFDNMTADELTAVIESKDRKYSKGDKNLAAWKLREINGTNEGDKPFSSHIAILKSQIATTKQIEQQLFNIWGNNPMARVTTTITRKTSGNLNSGKEQRNVTDLYPEADEIFFVPKVIDAGLATELVSSEGNKFERNPDATDYFNQDGVYYVGNAYMLIPGANSIIGDRSTYIPVKLETVSVDEASAKEAYDKVMEIITKIRNLIDVQKVEPKNVLANEDIKALKKELNNIMYVAETEKTGVKDYLKVFSDRIEFTFGDGFTANIYLTSQKTTEVATNLEITQLDADGKPQVIQLTNKKGRKVSRMSMENNPAIFEDLIKRAFAKKRFNVNFKNLQTKGEYKGHKSYARYLLATGKLTIDIDPIKGKDGKILKDGFGNPIPMVTSKSASKARNSNLVIAIDPQLSVIGQTAKQVTEQVKTDEAVDDVQKMYNEIAELTDKLEALKANTPEFVAEVFIAKLLGSKGFKVTPESAKKETGGKVGKDVNTAFTDKKGKTVEKLAEDMQASPELANMDLQDIRNIIIDILKKGKNNFIAEYSTDGQITELQNRIKDLEAKIKAVSVTVDETKDIAATEVQSIADTLFKEGKVLTNSKALAEELASSDEVFDKLTDNQSVEISETANGWLVKIIDLGTGVTRLKAVKPDTKAANTIDVQAAETWWKSVFGDNIPLDTNIANLLTRQGVQAWGVFEDAMVKISRQAVRGTEYHEAFHVVFWLYLDDAQRSKILDEAREKYGNLTALELEEAIADEFMDYMLKKGETNKVVPAAKGLFAKLWDWVRNWFKPRSYGGSKAIDKLFASIDSGTFKYAPDSKAVAYAKTIKRFKVVEGYTRSEEAETIGLLTKMYVDYADNTAVQNTEAMRTPKEFIKTELQRYLRIVPANKRKNINRVLLDLDKFMPKTIQNVSRQFGITQDEDLDNLEMQEIEKKWDDGAVFGTSSKDSISNYIKKVIMTTPKTAINSEGEYVSDTDTFLGLETFLDFNKVYPYIQRNMLGAATIEEMIDRLRNMSNHDPAIIHIVARLENDQNLRAAWYTQFHKQSPDKYVILLDNGQETSIKVDVSNKNTSHYLLANEWKSNFLAKIEQGNFSVEYLKQMGAIYKELEQLAYQDRFNNNKADIIDKTVDLLNNLGIVVTNTQLTKVINNPIIGQRFGSQKDVWTDIFKTGLASIYREIGIYNKLTAEEKLEYKFQSLSRLNDISQVVNLFQYDKIESSSFDVKGNNVYSSTNPHFMSNLFEELKAAVDMRYIGQDQAKERVLAMMQQFYMSDGMTRSNWLMGTNGTNGLILGNKYPNSIADINWDFVTKWNYGLIDGVKNLSEVEGEKYTEMSDSTWMATQLIMYLETGDPDTIRLPFLVPADKANIPFITSPRFRAIFKDGKLLENSDLFKALKNMVNAEIDKMKAAQKLMYVDMGDGTFIPKEHKAYNSPDYDSDIHVDYYQLEKNYHYQKTDKNGMPILMNGGKPTGNVFKFYNIPAIKVKSLFENGFVLNVNPETQLAIDTEITAGIHKFVENRIKKGKELYAEEIIKGTEQYARYNNFTEFIAEYMLNSHISNVEQFNFFIGDHAEYKHAKDSNKRAFEAIAPSVRPLLEVMGETFTGATIKDVELASDIYGSIAENVAVAIKREQPKLRGLEMRVAKVSKRDADEDLNELEKAVHDIVSAYHSINIGDGQGYVSIDRYEKIVKGLGRWSKNYEKLFRKVRKGDTLDVNDLNLFLQPIKGFYYGRTYSEFQGRFVADQVKYSSVPLIPQLIKGTDAEKLYKWMNENKLDEVFFESAEKVGITHVMRITDKDGKIDDNALNNYHVDNGFTHKTFENKNWGVQLDVPDHLMDADNLLGTQIAKLIISNLPADGIYTVNGKDYKTSELIQIYFDTMAANIQEDATNLIERIGAVKFTRNDGTAGYKFPDKNKLREVLVSEIERRGVSDNYVDAIELIDTIDGNEFTLPMFVSHMANKWESILTSLFTNNVTNQKLPGGSAVLLSSVFVTNKLNQAAKPTVIDLDAYDSATMGNINWLKEKVDANDFSLKMTELTPDGKVVAAEVLLPAWSEKFYIKDEVTGEYKLDDINNIPEEVRTMLWYRIPSEEKYSMVYTKVVGFLPQSMGSTIVMPREIVTSTGADFDVDKKFGVIPHFEVNDVDGKRTYSKVQFDESKSLQDNSRKARDNRIIDIWTSILSNPLHYKDTLSPQSFEDGKNAKAEVAALLGEDSDDINAMSVEGQLYFRKQNIAGRALKGMAADSNAFLTIAQVAKMKLREDLGFKILYPVEQRAELERKYGKGTEITKDGVKYIEINHNQLGWNQDGSFDNATGKTTTRHASQMLAMILDIVKEGIPDNVNTYTFYPYITMLNTGIDIQYTSMFIRQPILNDLAIRFFENQGAFSDGSTTEIEDIKKKYQKALIKEMVKAGHKIGNDKDFMQAVRDDNFFISAEMSKDLFGIESGAVTAFAIDELRNGLSDYATFKNGDRDNAKLIAYLKQQLKVLEAYKTYKEAGEAYNDVLNVFNTDKIGAGPSMSKTESLNRKIEQATYYYRQSELATAIKNKRNHTAKLFNVSDYNTLAELAEAKAKAKTEKQEFKYKDTDYVKFGEGARVFVNIDGKDIPATVAIYPEFFKQTVNGSVVHPDYAGMTHKSVYSILETYKQFANDLSVDVLGGEFIEHSPAFKDLFDNVQRFTGLGYNEKVVKSVSTFAKHLIMSELPAFKYLDRGRIMGVTTEIETNSDISFDAFKELSFANKLMIMKQRMKDQLADDTHIMNYLVPKMDVDTVKRNGTHMVEFINTKTDNLTDDRLTDSIVEMWNSEDEFVADLARDLVNHNFVSASFEMKKDSYGKLIPTSILKELGLGEHLYKAAFEMQNRDYFAKHYPNFMDNFIRNNAGNSNIVPYVQTKWADKTRSNTNGTPIWVANNGIITVTTKSLLKDDANIKKAPYITVPTYAVQKVNGFNVRVKTGTKLYRKYGEVNGAVKYYEVTKLGNRNMFELDNTTITDNLALHEPALFEHVIQNGHYIGVPEFKRLLETRPAIANAYMISDSYIGDTKFKSIFLDKNSNKDKYDVGENVLVTSTKPVGEIAPNNKLTGTLAKTYNVIKDGANVITDKGSSIDTYLDKFAKDGVLIKIVHNDVVSYSKTIESVNIGKFRTAGLTLEQRDALLEAHKNEQIDENGADCTN